MSYSKFFFGPKVPNSKIRIYLGHFGEKSMSLSKMCFENQRNECDRPQRSKGKNGTLTTCTKWLESQAPLGPEANGQLLLLLEILEEVFQGGKCKKGIYKQLGYVDFRKKMAKKSNYLEKSPWEMYFSISCTLFFGLILFSGILAV